MKKKAVFYSDSIHASIGVMGVQQSFIADLVAYFGKEESVLGCDYQSYYEIKWAPDERIPIVTKLEGIQFGEITPEIAFFTPWGPYQKILPEFIRLKWKGSSIAFQTWGFFAKQQCWENWEGGTKPLWLKKVATKTIQLLIRPFVDFYFVSGGVEVEDSNLNPERCVKISYGRPLSQIIENRESIDWSKVKVDPNKRVYVGRGAWIRKGLCNIVDYAKSEVGKQDSFDFHLSSPDRDLHEKIMNHGADDDRFYWDTEKRGGEILLPIASAGAFITLNSNPVQLRSLYEALSLGCPIVVFRPSFMDEVGSLAKRFGIHDAVQVVTLEGLKEGSEKIHVLKSSESARLRLVLDKLLDAGCFGTWFGQWVENPKAPDSYYETIAE